MNSTWRRITLAGSLIGLTAGLTFCLIAQLATPINQELMQRGFMILLLTIYLRVQALENKIGQGND